MENCISCLKYRFIHHILIIANMAQHRYDWLVMNIYITRHGQTNLNAQKLMQGLTDAPLNETGIAQAQKARAMIQDVHFDAVYSSPLQRAVKTASIIGDVPEDKVIKDSRIIEVNFGKYELCKYYKQGPWMTAYWLVPEIFPAPPTVEPVSSMVERSASFLKEIEAMPYENVLVTCHGGIMRALCGCLSDRKNGIKWRPHPRNCEIRVYESINGKHRFITDYDPEH